MQKERVELQRVFSAWKMRHIDEKREVNMTLKTICSVLECMVTLVSATQVQCLHIEG